MLPEPINLVAPVTAENFDEDSYLASNLDVKAAVDAGSFSSGRAHFELFGHKEPRLIWAGAAEVRRARAVKLEKLKPCLRTDLPWIERGGALDYLSDALRAATRIVDTDKVSSNGYDEDTLALIRKHRDGLVLDCGAGRRNVYHHNVVNFEIVAYDTTDVIGVGECLPFKDNSFDAVISIAVLEHVRDPFLCSQEIIRVLKPGGDLFCSVPFLQPMHGYPHHYFNATKQGIVRLFEDDLTIERVYVPPVGHPAFALHWFLTSWAAGLSDEAVRQFRDMTIGSLIDHPPDYLPTLEAGRLPPAQVDELACSFVVRATKP